MYQQPDFHQHLQNYHQHMASTSENPHFLQALQAQVDLYFSPQNIACDAYLFGLLQENYGVVPIDMIATFPMITKIFEAWGWPAGQTWILLKAAAQFSQTVYVSGDGFFFLHPSFLPLGGENHGNGQLADQPQVCDSHDQGDDPLPDHYCFENHYKQHTSYEEGTVSATVSPTSFASSNSSPTNLMNTVMVDNVPKKMDHVSFRQWLEMRYIRKNGKKNHLSPLLLYRDGVQSWRVVFGTEKEATEAMHILRTIKPMNLEAHLTCHSGPKRPEQLLYDEQMHQPVQNLGVSRPSPFEQDVPYQASHQSMPREQLIVYQAAPKPVLPGATFQYQVDAATAANVQPFQYHGSNLHQHPPGQIAFDHTAAVAMQGAPGVPAEGQPVLYTAFPNMPTGFVAMPDMKIPQGQPSPSSPSGQQVSPIIMSHFHFPPLVSMKDQQTVPLDQAQATATQDIKEPNCTSEAEMKQSGEETPPNVSNPQKEPKNGTTTTRDTEEPSAVVQTETQRSGEATPNRKTLNRSKLSSNQDTPGQEKKSQSALVQNLQELPQHQPTVVGTLVELPQPVVAASRKKPTVDLGGSPAESPRSVVTTSTKDEAGAVAGQATLGRPGKNPNIRSKRNKQAGIKKKKKSPSPKKNGKAQEASKTYAKVLLKKPKLQVDMTEKLKTLMIHDEAELEKE